MKDLSLWLYILGLMALFFDFIFHKPVQNDQDFNQVLFKGLTVVVMAVGLVFYS